MVSLRDAHILYLKSANNGPKGITNEKYHKLNLCLDCRVPEAPNTALHHVCFRPIASVNRVNTRKDKYLCPGHTDLDGNLFFKIYIYVYTF